MMRQSVTAAIAVVFGTGLAGIAFAQGTTSASPDTTAPPAAIASPKPSAQTPAGSLSANAEHLSQHTVKQAQEKLKSQGLYDGPIDGQQGPQMRAAIEKYQKQNGLPQTAMLDQQTLQQLLGTQSHS
jgi:peptidoglycan hydrolase-like protein with peptidoglycan-binding domain